MTHFNIQVFYVPIKKQSQNSNQTLIVTFTVISVTLSLFNSSVIMEPSGSSKHQHTHTRQHCSTSHGTETFNSDVMFLNSTSISDSTKCNVCSLMKCDVMQSSVTKPHNSTARRPNLKYSLP